MATYKNEFGEEFSTDLLNFSWSIMDKEEYEKDEFVTEEYDELIEHGSIPLEVKLKEDLKEIVPEDTPDPVYPDSPNRFIALEFSYSGNDVLKLNPIAERIYYPLEESADSGTLELSDKEKAVFTKMLRESIGDHHTPEMQRVMIEYHDAVDPEVRRFIRDTIEDADTKPITVGFVTSKMGEEIFRLTGIRSTANRIVLSADALAHILKRHGPNGTADHSLDMEDISRIGYVLANYDSILWNGENSKSHYHTNNGLPAPQITITKRIDGEYFVIEAVMDGKRKRCSVVTAYLRKTST